MPRYREPIMQRMARILATQESFPKPDDDRHYAHMLNCASDVVKALGLDFEAGVTKGPENKGVQLDFPNGVAVQLLPLSLNPPTTQMAFFSAGKPYAVASTAFGQKSATIFAYTSVEGLMETMRQASGAEPADVK